MISLLPYKRKNLLIKNIVKIKPVSFVFRNFAVVFFLALFTLSCEKDEVEFANGYPSVLAGNWVAFQFHGGDLDGQLTGPYDITTALDPNHQNKLVIDNIYNTGVRVSADIKGDTGFVANRTPQLEVINDGGYGIKTVSIDGYINDNYVLVDFLYSLAEASFENIAFTEDDMSEIMFFRAGLYDEYNSLVDSIMVMGYRKTGFENVDYN